MSDGKYKPKHEDYSKLRSYDTLEIEKIAEMLATYELAENEYASEADYDMHKSKCVSEMQDILYNNIKGKRLKLYFEPVTCVDSYGDIIEVPDQYIYYVKLSEFIAFADSIGLTYPPEIVVNNTKSSVAPEIPVVETMPDSKEVELDEIVSGKTKLRSEQVECESKTDCIFRKTSQSWHIKYNDSELIGIKDLVGMSYIHLLLQSPMKPIGVIDLQILMNGHQVKPDYYDESTAIGNDGGSSKSSKPRFAKGSLSMDKLKESLQKLAADRADAERDNDFGVIELIENEFEQIQKQIDQIKYGNQDKDPELERNRKKVAKNISVALKNIQNLEITAKRSSTPIYNHLNTYIKTGVTCCYNPLVDSQPCWIFY